MMGMVLSAFKPMPDALQCYPRLYAFPRQPDPPGDTFIILDSGAFGLAQGGRRIGSRHIDRLAEYYQRHCTAQVIAIAPDVYLDPDQTRRNFAAWQKRFPNLPVAPVLQANRLRTLDLYALRAQLVFYHRFSSTTTIAQLCGRPVIAIGNPGLWAGEANDAIRILCHLIRRLFPDAWIHLLGAGWSVDDIRGWAALGCLDSIDSIAYYEDAKCGIAWRGASEDDWRSIAVQNALAAVAAAKGEM